MKKIIYSALAVALAFFSASCQKEVLEPVADGNTVTYTVQVPGTLATKALGDEVTVVDKVYYQVYRAAEVADLTKAFVYDGEADVNAGTASFELEFVKNQNFVVLFWAQDEDLQMFNIDDLRKVQLTTPGASNNVNAQVFAGSDTVTDCVSGKGGNVELTRPISQLNIFTTKESLSFGGKAITLSTSTVKVDGLYTTYNVAEGAAVVTPTPAEFTYAAATVPATQDTDPYAYVAMNYVGFAPNASTTVQVDFTITTSEGDVMHSVSSVPVKPNYRTNIVGNLLTEAADYNVTLGAWTNTEENVEIIVDGLARTSDGTYVITSVDGFAYASQNLFAQNGGSYILGEDIDMAGASSVVTRSADGLTYKSVALTHTMKAGSFEFDGKGHTIKNLPGMFVAYTGSAKSVVIKNLTLETPNVAYDVEDVTETNGVGAFIGYAGTSTTITLDNCHVKGGEIKGGHWTGGLVGYAAGYSGNDGPVFETLTIKDCSVKNATVTGKGSCGAIIGHATGDDWTLVDMDDIAVTSNTIISTGTSTNKAGSVMGTLGNAGQPKTVNGVTKTGGVTIDGYEVFGNTVKSNEIANTKLWGRQGNSNGVLTIDGEKVEDFNTYVANSAVTVTNDEELAAAIAGATGDLVIKLAAGTYSNDINLTVAALGTAKGKLDFVAVEGAEPVIAGTVTLGYFENRVGATVWDAQVIFDGITFDHANPLTHSLSVQNVKGLTLKNCTVVGDGEYGIGAPGNNPTGPSSITNCEFVNAGLQLAGNFATNLVISDCVFDESCINVQGGNGVTVQNCEFNKTLKSANVGDSFYLVRSNSTPISVKGCEVNIDSELSEVADGQENWAIFWNRGTTNWTVENVAVTMTDAALMQTELLVKKCKTTGVINTNNLTVNGQVYVSSAAELTAAIKDGATAIVLDGEFAMPSNGISKAIVFNSLNGTAVIDNTKGAYWDAATLTFNNVNFKTGTGMAGSDYAALYSKNVTYNNCSFSGPMRIGRDGAKFNACTFNNLGNDYVWTYGKAASFDACTFNTDGKAILIYSDGGNGISAVSVTNCTFNATTGGKAGAIANQNCAAIEIHNYGLGVNLTTSDNNVAQNDTFSGEWRIKQYETRNPDSKIFVNGTEYTNIALDGRSMTIDANKNVTVL